jgi:phosphate uptake regulator
MDQRVVRHFQEELETLQSRLLEMGGLAEERVRAAVQSLVNRDIAQTMLRDALDSFVRRDTVLAHQVLNEDDRLDGLKTQIFRELLSYMLQDPGTVEPALDLILISRHLERIGDHATNIAEDVIFMVSARDVRHHASNPPV